MTDPSNQMFLSTKYFFASNTSQTAINQTELLRTRGQYEDVTYQYVFFCCHRLPYCIEVNFEFVCIGSNSRTVKY